ncbi:MAG: hypothetical protein AABZ08_02945 [Planctomycetota bacterium]
MNLLSTCLNRCALRCGLAAACGLLAIAAASAPALGQCSPQQLAKLIASDAASADQLGFSVAVSGDTAVVGSIRDTHSGAENAGSAYVFVSIGGVWTQQAKLIASDARAGAAFGSSITISGDTVVVGAPLHYNAPGDPFISGSVYVFVRSSGIWTQQARLAVADANPSDQFGTTVAVSGDTAAAGAAFGDAPGAPNAGALYVFVRSGGIWTQQAKLTASDATANEDFGRSLALSSNTIVVGAYTDDHAGGSDAGSAYVFVRTGTVWTQQTKLIGFDTADGDNFGKSVVVSGDTALVGAWFDVHAGGPGSPFNGRGSAYVFARSGVVWTQQAKLIASDAEGADFFGHSVALSGDTAVIGAVGDDHPGVSNAGSAYVFARASAAWTQQAKLIASDAAAVDQFGWSVGVSGDTAVVGTYSDDNAAGADAGAAYIFDLGCVAAFCAGDFNGDNMVTNADIPDFVAAQLAGACPAPPATCPGDFNADGVVNGADTAGFVAKVLGGGACP